MHQHLRRYGLVAGLITTAQSWFFVAQLLPITWKSNWKIWLLMRLRLAFVDLIEQFERFIEHALSVEL